MPDVEVYRGLVGTIVVTDPAHARDDGSPDDVDREVTTLWLIFNENTETTPDSLEEANDWHTPHWHGETILVEGKTYNDVIELGPASMKVGDMVADNPGTWLLHCHVGDHMMAGMYATYTIVGSSPAATASLSRDVGPGWSPF
jgi:FtsP/CotA-like multicopper oxidase with cupredoxin domain